MHNLSTYIYVCINVFTHRSDKMGFLCFSLVRLISHLTAMEFILILIFCIASLCSVCSSRSNQAGIKNILVFGGNGFIGASTVEELLRANYTVVTVNRGNWYWDSETRVMPYVKNLKCDRMMSLQKCSALQMYLWDVDAPSYFDAVIDFSAYHVFEISEALQLLHGKAMKYIYISSDSVYEVCVKNHSDPTREDDAVRPTSKSDQDILNQQDSYGHRKLECEEHLEFQSRDKNGVPYIAFRLPDVIGPRDNTYRWWLYQLWIKLAKYLDKQPSVPHKFWNQPMSLVYVEDVAGIILNSLEGDLDLYNQAYNLALEERPTLVQLLHSLMDELDIEDVQIETDYSNDAFHLLPSITSGPLDITKAKRLLRWKPSSWFDVLGTTVQFYEKAMIDKKFRKPRNDVIRTLQKHFVKDPLKVLHALKEIYGLTFDSFRDEL